MLLWLNSLRFSTKLIILSLLPTLITIVLAGRILHAKFNHIEQLTKLEQSIKRSLLLDNIAHQHAIERGLTSGFFTSRSNDDRQELEKQRLKSDKAWHKYDSFIQDLNQTESGKLAENNQIKLTELISKKNQTRDKVDAFEPNNGAFNYYSALNSTLADMIEVTALQLTDPNLSNSFFTYRTLLNTKEKAGQVRGRLNGIFKVNAFSKNDLSTIRDFIRDQNINFDKATSSASDEFSIQIKALTQSNDFKIVTNIHEIVSSENDPLSVIHSEFKSSWFTIASKTIDGFQAITDNMASSVINKVNIKISDARATLYSGIGALAALILVTYFLTWWLIQNLTTRINTLRDTLHTVFVTGNLKLRSSDMASDEIGEISSTLNNFLSNFQNLVTDIKLTSTSLLSQSDDVSQVTIRNKASVDSQREQTDLLASAITEMAASFAEVARTTHDAELASDEAHTNSQQGKQSVNQTSSSVTNLSNEILKAEDTIEEVALNCKRIGTILDTIRGIAEQTNLLALNAAIEAARAGDQGRGFAVVADEVRTLAQRTQESTEEINNMIIALQQSSQNAHDTMTTSRSVANECLQHASDSGISMDNIDVTIKQVYDLSIQIAAATEEQTAVSNEVTQNIIIISNSAEDILTAAEEIEQGGIRIQSEANKLNEKIQRYQV